MPALSSVERVFQGFFAIDRHTIVHPDFPQPIVREIFARGQAACVLVYDPRRDQVMLVEEFRAGNHAAGFTGHDAVSLGPIAGMIDPGETPAQAAGREAGEEAGMPLHAQALMGPLATFPSPGGTSEIIHHFVALADLSGVEDGARFGLATEGESTRVRLFSRADLDPLAMGQGRVPANGLTITCLFLLHALIASNRLPQGPA